MKTLLLLTTLLLSSCAAPNTIMVNPNDQSWNSCSTWGFGLMGLMTAVIAHDNCVESLRQIGYVTADEYNGR